jgi:hypothetical protein
LDKNQVRRLIEDQIHVTSQQVTIAKAYIMNHFNSDTSVVLKSLLKAMEVTDTERLVVHLSEDTENSIKSVSQTFSWCLAGCEAIWGLISSGLLIPGDQTLHSLLPHVSYSTVVQGSGTSGGIRLEHLNLPVPSTIILPPSISMGESQTLSDPDLFVHALEITEIHKEVEEALREAVRCFKNELFLACLAMLGRASEGAWIELGLKLCTVVPETAKIKVEKIREKLEDPFIGVGKKIQETAQLYQRSDIFENVYKASGIKPQNLKNEMIWADAVRESRNSLHYGAVSAIPNTYEKVAALLIGAVPHFRLLYRVRAAAK